jgi:energy-coupling factor transporter ATP-binding protein EcfA2
MFQSTQYPKGSEWRKWDLHIHSPLSFLNNQFPHAPSGEPDWESYLRRLEGSDFAVAGVTDYFTIEGYKRLKEFKAQGRLQNIVALFPNIEFRLSHVLSSRRDSTPRRLNLHVIFSDEVSPQDIEEHFLHDLTFFYQGTPQADDEVRKLKISNLAELGKRLMAEHPRFRESGKSPLEIGAMTAVVNHEDITELLRRDSRFREKYLVVYPDEGYSLIDWDGQDHLIRKGILQKADMVFSSNPRTRSWCLGQNPYTGGTEAFVKEFRSLKPCIHGSDAHSLGEIGRPCARRGASGHSCSAERGDCELRFCWIKADPTFEGLKQLLYEPEDRVRIQEVDPTPRKSIFTVARVQIPRTRINAELAIAETQLPLNSNLVAVTGSKGGGKTALVDMLAHCFMDREHTTDRNSFVRRISGDAPTLPIQIEFAGGKQFEKTLADGVFFEDTELAYIAQGELERYIDEHSDLNEYLHSLIFESPTIRDTLTAFEYESQTSTVEALQRDLDAKNGVVIELEAATSSTVTADIEKKGRQVAAELSDVTERLQQLQQQLSQEKIEANTKRQERVTGLKAVKEELSAARDLVLAARRAIDSDLARMADVVTQLNAAITRLELGPPLAVPAYPDVGRLEEVNTAIQGKLREVVKKIEAEERNIQATAAEVRQHTQLLRRKKELEAQASALREQWRQIGEKKVRLKAERASRTELLAELLNAVLDQQARYRDVIAAFGAQRENILSDLSFEAIVSVDATGLMEALESLVDNRQVTVKDPAGAPVACAALVDLLRRLASGERPVIPQICSEVDKLRADLRSKLKKAVGTQALDHVLYRSHLSVQPVARYKNTSLDCLSLGQKATVLIKIYLAAGDKPIIIDSHDDHLDNEYIMDELVGAIRQAKERRQVILASNNGNVVLNSDAEQVIVAQRRDGTLSYLSGALEDPGIREIALRVLEGGYDAFKRRQQKYRMADRQ